MSGLEEGLDTKNWDYHQAKMNRSLNDFIQNLSYDSKSPKSNLRDFDMGCLDNERDFETRTQLNQNSTTVEFKKYLEELKRNYLEKLTFSCPPKLTKNTSNKSTGQEINSKLKSVENLSNFLRSDSSSSAKRTLLYDEKSINKNPNQLENFMESHENKNLNLYQQKNSNEPELSNTQILSRLVQIREYLKQAYSMLTTLQTSNNPFNYSAQMNKLHSLIDHLKDQEKGYMDLLNSFSKFQQLNPSLFEDSAIENQPKSINNNSFSKKSMTKEDNDSEAGSICGSFISDTLTLNCNNMNEIVDKYRKSIHNCSNQNKDDQELVVIGKGFNTNVINETFEDEKTENDQDILDFDEDYLTSLLKNVGKREEAENLEEQREEILRHMNTNRDTLEQLKEQKELLRSIKLRKEELKALEGRQKALKALQKIAIEGEKEVDEAFKILPISDDTERINPSSLNINRGVQTENETPRKPMIRKTVKPKETNRSNENLDSISAQIEPSSQIEKSKITAKHYEDLIRKILAEKYSENLIKTVSSSDLIKIGQLKDENPGNVLTVDNDENSTNEDDRLEELEAKRNELEAHEKQLDELYQMQSKLANLKTIINHFNELKNERKSINKEQEYLEETQQLVDEKQDENDMNMDEINLEETSKKEIIEIHKKKLNNAKEKLQELQDLISRLQILSDDMSSIDLANELNISQSQIHEMQQAEANKALHFLNEIERQKKEEKLEELKQNKQKLLEILRQKDQEARVLENFQQQKNNSTNDISYLNEIESKFKSAENGFDILSLENLQETEMCHSPSDVLWSQMKKQLNMRENLRNKKKEFEDIIREEYARDEEEKKEIKNYDQVEKFESPNDENNEILNGYRDFFLRKRTDSEKKAKLLSEFFEQEKIQQENICPPDELIQDEESESSTTSSESEIEEEEDLNENNLESQNYVPMKCLNDLGDKIENLLTNQQKMNENMFKNFTELFEKKFKNEVNNVEHIQTPVYQSQFQTQLQIQQLMFNLNTAYHEISTQRTELSRLNDQMTNVNKELAELKKNKNTQNTVGVNTENRNEATLSRTSIVAALPSYFYNRKKNENSKCEINDYTDDFEDLDEDDDERKEKNPPTRTESSLSSSTNENSNSISSASSVQKLKKSLQLRHKSGEKNYKSLTFEKMREQIYSEVATLISQNESRPFYLLNLFKELQFIRDKNARDQVLKSIFNISNRHKINDNVRCNSSTTSDSNLDLSEKIFLSRKYENKKEVVDDEQSSQTPFESDSLSNTVIFVKNSPKDKKNEKLSGSSGSSILGVDENYAQDQENIGSEVKKFISQIISSIKTSENFDFDDDERSVSSNSNSESSSSKNFKNAYFDLDYLNEIIEKVLSVLRQSEKHSNYIKFYESQLNSYLREALRKYDGKFLVDCMEDILIEISDILYNELTFYSTLSKAKIKKNTSEVWSNAKNFSRSSTSTSSSSCTNISSKMDKTEDNFKKCKYQSIELLKRLSDILNSKFGNLKSMNDYLMDEQLAQERNKLESLQYDLKKEFENVSLLTNCDNYGPSSIKYLKNSEVDSSCCGDDENFQDDIEAKENELPYKIIDINELKNDDKNEITIDDIPVEMSVEKKENSKLMLDGLDKIIMDSISDNLVGDPNELGNLLITNAHQNSGNEENHLKSDSSNSDHFVIISGSTSKESDIKIEKSENSESNQTFENGRCNDKNELGINNEN
ncbi:unnamed protein product [Brachionus calyciflorus]|uniref:Pericentriolar material 1 n=1 Tax=Brachionus calyciflorus TaxID=104777 RepID=A0A813P7R5_9BILA|nr:unnamed protein product [Brachionus calyciflorus]